MSQLVIVNDMLVHPAKSRCLVEGGASFRSVLPVVKHSLSLLLLKDALIPFCSQLWFEPIIISVLLDFLQCDDVGCHALQLFQDQMLPPRPRERPLLAVRIERLCGIHICKNIPIHHLELLYQPLSIESAAIADHSPRPGLLWSRNHRARCYRHSTSSRIPPVLHKRDNLQPEWSVYILHSWVVGSCRSNLYPLGNRLLVDIRIFVTP
mmetsp:Transcript_827/g.1827  ORF Transcript_827/g.1827 Transcript_827/m.1827 type:complete len:208 (+) Transcript_827:889-1512(+)